MVVGGQLASLENTRGQKIGHLVNVNFYQYYTSNGHHVPLENRHTKRVSVEYHQDQADSRWRQQQRQPGCPGPGHRHQLCKIDHTLNSPLNHFGLV